VCEAQSEKVNAKRGLAAECCSAQYSIDERADYSIGGNRAQISGADAGRLATGRAARYDATRHNRIDTSGNVCYAFSTYRSVEWTRKAGQALRPFEETMTSRTRRTRTRVNGHADTAALSKRNGAPAPGKPAPAGGTKSHPIHDKHKEIFSTALHLFQQKGYHGASMQDLADAMGMQKASLYYYIDSKEELLVRVCERGTGAFTSELRGIVASDLRATEKLRRAVECHLVALCEQLDLFTVFLREQKFLGEPQKKKLRNEGKQHAELLAAILQEGIATGEFREVNVTVTTLAILGMCNWLYEWYSPDGPLEPRAIAGMFSELVLNGLASKS
jgi:AcrR family transcriptional regulator